MTPCPHTYTTPTRFTKANGAQVVRLQCDRCGAGLQERPKSQYQFDQLPEFNGEKFKEWQRREDESRRREWLTAQMEQDEAWWERYNEYLRTAHWQSVRSTVLCRDKVCQVCFTASSNQVHHFSYASFNRWGISFAGECAGVCRACHDTLHPEET